MIDGEHLRLDLTQLRVLSLLGRGAKGVVFLVQDKSSRDLLALKVISKAMISDRHAKKKKKKDRSGGGYDDELRRKEVEDDYRRILFEQKVLAQLQHPLLPKLHGIVDTDKVFGYAIDYCPGQDLNSLRRKQTEKMFSDDIIRFYAAELVLVLEYLHKLGIVYRDLKPENVMIQENGHLMLVDFDLSTKLSPKSPDRTNSNSFESNDSSSSSQSSTNKWKIRKWCYAGVSPAQDDLISHSRLGAEAEFTDARTAVVGTKSNSFVGTEEYVAPEIILGHGHDFAVDWFSLGVVLYEMLYGTTPFRGSNRKETFYRILSKKPELVGETTPLRDLIGKLLEKDPKQRITLEEIKGHEFFRGLDWELVVQIPRTPYIPWRIDGEDTEGIEEMDVEKFVQEVFSGGDDRVVHRCPKDSDTESRSSSNNSSNSTDNFSNF